MTPLDDRSRGGAVFTDADFARIAQRARTEFGLHLPATRKDLVYARLVKRLRQLDLRDFHSYCCLLDGPDGVEERSQMLSALTTNVTHFFREAHHFKLLRDQILPPLIRIARARGRVRLWSAGCSAGQEPYSLAFTLLEMCPEAGKLDIRILATDVDPQVLHQAAVGVYPAEDLKALPEPARRLTEPVAQDSFRIGDKVRYLVRFAPLNLIEDWPMRGPFDVIFCRNVAIYFDKETQSRLWHRLADLLPEGGHLFIGHSERVAGPAETALHSIGVTAYCKEPDGRKGTQP